MKWLRRSIWLVVFMALGIGALSLYYVLPRHDVVMITGVEVKRMDADGVINAENPADGPTRDVYFINTEDPDTKKVVVYRNEDTGWSFPWYFKFDSADIQAKAQGYSRDSQQLALIRYYGWRITILSMFPNVTEVEAVTSRDQPLPVFNTVFFVVVGLLVVMVVAGVRKRFRRQPRVDGVAR
ncbi:DUF1523 family protein [Pseudomonas amygdali]|uniref:DUF1523 family protein n=1 Tax=Pseudomonas amygdali TaxID=47877 RepID=UPI0006E529BF|nr:DUF1523 family protein [Pseudomonas amygdali]KPY59033.1 Uncharacterized protein ALO93_01858 [Pseudomonas amygdali pv. sesami]RMT89190.1 hypothetical protein ALP38_00583 [Pseudomonas amygdali pv. sesami]RMT96318.1 hypothetical protein ALP37_02700 [Pseudomonas amygdali pv. sesami]RMV89049.1 hypothetical protein ALP04_01258 [Pseudomonas amygdali pv. sesami]